MTAPKTPAEITAAIGVALEMAEDAKTVLWDARRLLKSGNEAQARDFIRTAARDLSGALGALNGL